MKAADPVREKLLAQLKLLQIDPEDFDLFDDEGELDIDEARDTIVDAIEGERENARDNGEKYVLDPLLADLDPDRQVRRAPKIRSKPRKPRVQT